MTHESASSSLFWEGHEALALPASPWVAAGRARDPGSCRSLKGTGARRRTGGTALFALSKIHRRIVVLICASFFAVARARLNARVCQGLPSTPGWLGYLAFGKFAFIDQRMIGWRTASAAAFPYNFSVILGNVTEPWLLTLE